MKKSFLLAPVLVLLLCLFSTSTFADVTGSGSFTPIMPEGSTWWLGNYGRSTSYDDPITGETIYVNNYYGSISEHPGYFVAFGMQETTDQDGYKHYSGSDAYSLSSVSGTHDEPNGMQTFGFSAVSPGAGVEVWAEGALGGWIRYTGIIENLGYDYFFTGLKSDPDPDDMLNFIIQMEIYYEEPDPNNPAHAFFYYAYSDYGTGGLLPGGGYRNNWAYYYDTESGTYNGQIRFNYPEFGPHDWTIRWDFFGSGRDTTPGSPVPVPASLLLLGSGLAGLAGLRRRFKR